MLTRRFAPLARCPTCSVNQQAAPLTSRSFASKDSLVVYTSLDRGSSQEAAESICEGRAWDRSGNKTLILRELSWQAGGNCWRDHGRHARRRRRWHLDGGKGERDSLPFTRTRGLTAASPDPNCRKRCERLATSGERSRSFPPARLRQYRTSSRKRRRVRRRQRSPIHSRRA